jgi:SAM-dependent methyltransferase
MGTYIYDQAWSDEKQRLDALSALYDEGTIRHLERLGVSPGSVWAEVGAGSGTIATWLANQVGADGRLVVTDVDTRFIEEAPAHHVEVRTHDISVDELEQEAFDGVHIRAVLEHLPERHTALKHIMAALRPGGWLLAEDVVFPAPYSHPDLPVLAKVVEGFALGFRAAGADPCYGLQLPGALIDVGFFEIGCEGRAPVVFSGSDNAAYYALSLEHLRDKLASAGLLSKEDAEEALRVLREPGHTMLAPTMIATWGRKAPSA